MNFYLDPIKKILSKRVTKRKLYTNFPSLDYNEILEPQVGT